jgi:hypothetical protein
MALTKASYSMVNGAPLNVKDFGVVGDGVTDDTVAFQAALDATVNMTPGFGGTGRTLIVPNGIYLVGDLAIRWTGTRLIGESKFGTLLKGKAGAECVLKVGGINYSYPVGDPLRNINRRETIIENLTIDYTDITDTDESAGIRYQSSYGNALRNIAVLYNAAGEGALAKWGIYFGEGCYTTIVDNVSAKRIQAYSPTTDRPTTITFIGLDSGFVKLNNTLSITFLQPVMQSTTVSDYGLYRIFCLNCFSVTVIGGDFEDNDPAHYVYYFDNVVNVTSLNNELVPFAGGYANYGPSGITGKRFLQDDKTKQFEYREGTWTPVLSWSVGGTSTIVAANRGGTYIKNGNLVTCSFFFDDATFTNGTATGFLNLTALPFTAATTGTDTWGGTPTLQIGYPSSLQSILVTLGTSTATFRKNDGTGGNIVVADVSGSGKFLRGTFTYQCVN